MKIFALVLTLAMPAVFAEGFPDGAGKDLVMDRCGSCHGLDQVSLHTDSHAGWETLVNYMVSRGMDATGDELKSIIDYLAKSFPKAKDDGKSKGKEKAK